MRQPRVLKISVRVLGQAIVVDLQGGIDITNSTELRSALFDALSANARLVVNMTGVNYMDSSGIASMVEVLKKTRDLKKQLVLFGLGPSVHAVLRMTHLLGMFQVVDNEEQALAGTVA